MGIGVVPKRFLLPLIMCSREVTKMKHVGDITQLNGYDLPVVDVITGGSRTYRVYKYTFPNGLVYIGVTSRSIQKRRDCGYQHNKRLTEAYRSCGWGEVKTEILFETSSEQEAFKKEIELIEKFDSTNPLKGYNVSKGGKATYRGLSHTDEYKTRMSHLHKGKVYSEETLRRMKESHVGERTPVVGISEDAGERILHESLHAAAKAVEGYAANILRACKTKRCYKGFYWELASERG